MREIDGAQQSPWINASEHSARGFVCCTCYGAIVWRGPLSSIPDELAFDIVHCHDDDVHAILRMLIGGERPDPIRTP